MENNGNDYTSNKEVNSGEFKYDDKYNYLKDMDTSRLEAMLLQVSFMSDDSDFDTELIQHIIFLLEERNPEFDNLDVELSLRNFRKEIVATIDIAKESPTTYKSLQKLHWKKILVATLIMTLLGSMITVSALGYNVWHLVVNWGREVFQVGTSVDITGDVDNSTGSVGKGITFMSENKSFNSAEEAKQEYSADVLIPRQMPDELKLVQASISETPGHKSLILIYQEDGKNLIFSADRYENNDPAYTFERNEEDGDVVIINNKKHYFMTNLEQISVVWIINNYVYNLNGNVSREAMLEILNSIYQGDE